MSVPAARLIWSISAIDTVPQKYANRNLYLHNPQVTLMRTTAEENLAIGRFIAAKLNQMEGPVRFLLPLKGVSLIDAPGKPFHDPAADRMLFDTLESEFRPGAQAPAAQTRHEHQRSGLR